MSWEFVSCWIEHHPGLASWVQAFGSIGAIIAAGYFPIAHEKVREKRDRRNILRTLSYLADPLEKIMQQLSQALLETDYQNRWLASDGSRQLSVLGKALTEIPASMVVAFEVTLLTDLKFACECAIEADQYLKVSNPGAIRQLPENIDHYNACRNCIERLQLVKNTLSGLIEANQ
ncbi:hypothetical protein [Pseudomonas sp. OV226]|uniref:hypothetical protein n=1 Tax=Pseudomonas sp. OV226 TaxID=2135588 RepID=UPI000D79FD23|nr:hypothetical protein [Pseudomonas sp. OV226]PWK42262.1 hypothetical protein C7534_10569 [Pseudomonas sp. OV226]